MILSELQTALKRFGFDDSDPLTFWINAALHEIEDAADWSFLLKSVDIVVAAGASTIATPADFFRAMSIRHSDGFKLKWRDPREFDDEIEDFTVTGTPSWYTTIGQAITRIYPTADVGFTATLIYQATLVDLVGDGDTPGIPLGMHYNCLVQLAAAIALQAENEEDRSANARAQAESALARSVIRYNNETIDEFKQVRDAQDYGAEYGIR